MFDIGFSELLLVFVIGLIVLGPQRLPVAVKTVASWIRTLRSLAATVQNEITQELKLQEFQESLKKVEKASLDNLTPELKASMDELREAAESMKRSYSAHDPEKASDEANTIHNPVVKGSEEQLGRNYPLLFVKELLGEVPLFFLVFFSCAIIVLLIVYIFRYVEEKRICYAMTVLMVVSWFFSVLMKLIFFHDVLEAF